MKQLTTFSIVAFLALAANAQAQIRIGFIDPACRTAWLATTMRRWRLPRPSARPAACGRPPSATWQEAGGRLHAPEEFDVIWYYQGDDAAAAIGEAAGNDLLAYLEGGGTLLLSGAAGRLLNDLGIESRSLRVLPPSGVPVVSGIRVREKHRSHPVFAGLDTARPILLTTVGGNALADFCGSGDPHGQLLAEGTAGQGERPLVEYTVGAGRVILVGWRLPDFTTAGDPYRSNLERLFRNLLGYLAAQNHNRGRLIAPPGESRYSPCFGVPLLRAAKPFAVKNPAIRTKIGPSCSPSILRPIPFRPTTLTCANYPWQARS